jgi:hypothetical protein
MAVLKLTVALFIATIGASQHLLVGFCDFLGVESETEKSLDDLVSAYSRFCGVNVDLALFEKLETVEVVNDSPVGDETMNTTLTGKVENEDIQSSEVGVSSFVSSASDGLKTSKKK